MVNFHQKQKNKPFFCRFEIILFVPLHPSLSLSLSLSFSLSLFIYLSPSLSSLYFSVPQPVCRDTLVCRQIYLGELLNLRISKKVLKNTHIFFHFSVIFTLSCAANIFIEISVPQAQKVWELMLYLYKSFFLLLYLFSLYTFVNIFFCSKKKRKNSEKI